MAPLCKGCARRRVSERNRRNTAALSAEMSWHGIVKPAFAEIGKGRLLVYPSSVTVSLRKSRDMHHSAARPTRV